jgi:hypothetical protein
MKTACIGLLLALQKRYLSFLVTRGMLVSGPTPQASQRAPLLQQVHAAEDVGKAGFVGGRVRIEKEVTVEFDRYPIS